MMSSLKFLKGVAFTIDALVAIALLLLSITIFMFFISEPIEPMAAYDYELAQNTMESLKELSVGDLDNNPRYPEANDVFDDYSSWAYDGEGGLKPVALLFQDRGSTPSINFIAGLWLEGEESRASSMAEELLSPSVPLNHGFGLEVRKPGLDCESNPSEWSCVYSDARGEGYGLKSVGKHFVYYNGTFYGVRLVLHQ